jgi:filamentous hemagglutinin
MQAIGDAAVEAPFINPDGTLLNAQNAVIDPNKIINYALNPTPNQSGGDNKAIVFNSALGYNQSNAADLIQQLQAGVSNYPATVAGVNNYGNRFTVNIPVTGPNSNTLPVTTGWIYDPGSKTPRLITAYIK